MPHPVPGAPAFGRAPSLAPAFARTVLAMALQSAAVAGLGASAAHAQTLPASAAAQRFDLPAAPLDRALNAFATQAGILLTADGSLTAGKTGAALHGRYSVREGLAALLAGSGLEAVPQAGQGGGYALRRAAVPAAPVSAAEGTALATVNVTAAAERSAVSEGTGSYATRQSGTAMRLGLSQRETPQSVSVVTRSRISSSTVCPTPWTRPTSTPPRWPTAPSMTAWKWSRAPQAC
jgi:hypothetical protein